MEFLTELFGIIMEHYKPDVHPSSIIFITKLPVKTEKMDIKNHAHQVSFDDPKTKEAVSPLIDNFLDLKK